MRAAGIKSSMAELLDFRKVKKLKEGAGEVGRRRLRFEPHPYNLCENISVKTPV